jgi:hypothetical protein
VIANDVHHRRVRAHRVVQVRQTVGETGSKVQQRDRGPVEHARVPVGRARHHAFEQAKHATHVTDAVERGDKVHFRRAGVGKADVDVILQQCGK